MVLLTFVREQLGRIGLRWLRCSKADPYLWAQFVSKLVHAPALVDGRPTIGFKLVGVLLARGGVVEHTEATRVQLVRAEPLELLSASVYHTSSE
jgi:hypothetical protein